MDMDNAPVADSHSYVAYLLASATDGRTAKSRLKYGVLRTGMGKPCLC